MLRTYFIHLVIVVGIILSQSWAQQSFHHESYFLYGSEASVDHDPHESLLTEILSPETIFTPEEHSHREIFVFTIRFQIEPSIERQIIPSHFSLPPPTLT